MTLMLTWSQKYDYYYRMKEWKSKMTFGFSFPFSKRSSQDDVMPYWKNANFDNISFNMVNKHILSSKRTIIGDILNFSTGKSESMSMGA